MPIPVSCTVAVAVPYVPVTGPEMAVAGREISAHRAGSVSYTHLTLPTIDDV